MSTRFHLDLVGAMQKLAIRVMPHEPEITLEVDASALINSIDDIVFWYLYNDPEDTTMWNHPQSHGDQYFALVDVLLGIACLYVDRRKP